MVDCAQVLHIESLRGSPSCCKNLKDTPIKYKYCSELFISFLWFICFNNRFHVMRAGGRDLYICSYICVFINYFLCICLTTWQNEKPIENTSSFLKTIFCVFAFFRKRETGAASLGNCRVMWFPDYLLVIAIDFFYKFILINNLLVVKLLVCFVVWEWLKFSQ